MTKGGVKFFRGERNIVQYGNISQSRREERINLQESKKGRREERLFEEKFLRFFVDLCGKSGGL
jgi:hypothetical protein